MLRAVILDVDGTLIDSNEAHARSWQEALREKSIDPPFLEIRWRIGMGADRLMPELAGFTLESAKGQAIDQRRKQIFNERYLPHLKPFPKVRELLEAFKAEGLKLIIGTSAGGDLLHRLLIRANVDDLIDASTSSDDADRSKPAPDIIRAALDEARLSPEEAVMIGDTPYDVASATRAGVKIVGVTCGGWDAEELEPAVAVYRDAADILGHLDRSVFTHNAPLTPPYIEAGETEHRLH